MQEWVLHSSSPLGWSQGEMNPFYVASVTLVTVSRATQWWEVVGELCLNFWFSA